jgi:hypothetical protein
MKVLGYTFLYYICHVKSKRKQALPRSNLSGINLTCTNCRENGLSFSTVLLYNLVAKCLKKPNIVFLNINPKKGQHISVQDKMRRREITTLKREYNPIAKWGKTTF